MSTKTQTTRKPPSSERWLRAGVSRGISDGVDRKVGIIRGFSVITKGEARGHGMSIDDTTLDQVVELGNQSRAGMKSRFGHPQMSSDALGTFLGRTTNFRRDGDQVRADLELDESAFSTPKGNLADYVLKLAETDPGAFASSIVFIPGDMEEIEDSDALPLARVEKLLAVDVVDEGAANVGLFGAGFFTGQVELSAAATRALDELLLRPDAIEKMINFLERFSSSRESKDFEEQSRKELPMADPKSVQEDLEKTRAEAFAAGKAEGDAAQKEIHAAAVKAERERILSIRKAAFAGQDDLVNKAIDEGLSLADAQAGFIAAKKRTDEGRLQDVRKDTVPALGASPDSNPAKGELEIVEPEAGVEFDEARFSAQYDKSKNLQTEFRNDKKSYLAYCKAASRGHISTRSVK